MALYIVVALGVKRGEMSLVRANRVMKIHANERWSEYRFDKYLRA